MNRLPISYYDTHSNGDIMSRAINDMDNIASPPTKLDPIYYQFCYFSRSVVDDAND